LKTMGKQLLVSLVLLVTLLGLLSQNEVVRDWWRRGRPPHPYIMPSGIAVWRLSSVPLDDQFTHTFYYGEECGRLLGIEGAAERGKAIPSALRDHFFDGVGHGYEPPEDILQTIDEIEAHVPSAFAVRIHDGVLRHHAMINKGDPSIVVPFAEKYLRVSGLPEPYNGVRIGLQRSLGHRLPQALEIASSYPEAYWAPLFEELGWRASRHRPPRGPNAPDRLLDDEDFWAEATEWVMDHLKYVPETAHCHFLHGASRGRGLGYPWIDQHTWSRIQDEIDQFPAICRTACFQGIGWAVFIQAAHRPGRMRRMLRAISDRSGQAIAKRTVDAIEDSLSSTDQEPLSLWNIDGVNHDDPADAEMQEAAPEDRP
jgi:hypothetical protein